jgi:hypothetical protein
VAVGHTIRSSLPNAKRVSGSDFINVTAEPLTVAQGDVLYQAIISSQAGTRLAQETQMYQKWIARKIQFEFSGTGGTATPGMLAIAIVRDPDDVVPTDRKKTIPWIMNHEGAVMIRNWSEGKVTLNCKNELFTSDSGSDKRFWSPGRLVCVAVTGNGSQPVEMVVTMKWTIDLFDASNELDIDDDNIPLSMVTTQPIMVKCDYYTSAIPALTNEDTHMAMWNVDQTGATVDPATWRYQAFSIDNTPFSSLPDGAVIKSDVPWVANINYNNTTGWIPTTSHYYVVKRGADVYNGHIGEGTHASANVLQPAWYVNGTIHPGGTLGASGGRFESFCGNSPLPAGTVLTYVNPNIEEVDEVMTIMKKGLTVTKPTGKKTYRRKDISTNGNYIPNYTQTMLNSMPVMRVVPLGAGTSTNSGMAVTIVGQTGAASTLRVHETAGTNGDDPVPFNLTQVGGTSLASNASPGNLPVVLNAGVGTIDTQPVFIAPNGVIGVDVRQIDSKPLAGNAAGTLPITLSNGHGTATGDPIYISGVVGATAVPVSGTVNTNVIKVGTVVVTDSLPVSGFPTTQVISGTVDTNIVKVGTVTLTDALPVSGFPATQVVSGTVDTNLIKIGPSTVIADTVPTSATFPSSMDVRALIVDGNNVAFGTSVNPISVEGTVDSHTFVNTGISAGASANWASVAADALSSNSSVATPLGNLTTIGSTNTTNQAQALGNIYSVGTESNVGIPTYQVGANIQTGKFSRVTGNIGTYDSEGGQEDNNVFVPLVAPMLLMNTYSSAGFHLKDSTNADFLSQQQGTAEGSAWTKDA